MENFLLILLGGFEYTHIQGLTFFASVGVAEGKIDAIIVMVMGTGVI